MFKRRDVEIFKENERKREEYQKLRGFIIIIIALLHKYRYLFATHTIELSLNYIFLDLFALKLYTPDNCNNCNC